VNNGIVVVRVTQQMHQRAHTVKVELGLGKLRGMFETIIYKAVEVIEGVVVSGFCVYCMDCKALSAISKLQEAKSSPTQTETPNHRPRYSKTKTRSRCQSRESGLQLGA
jgi:hypothetical protein